MKDENMILLLLALAGAGGAVLYYLNKDVPDRNIQNMEKKKILENLEKIRQNKEIKTEIPKSETPQTENVEPSKPPEQKDDVDNPFNYNHTEKMKKLAIPTKGKKKRV